MSGQALPTAPETYDKRQIQQALTTIEQRLAALEEAQNAVWQITTKKVDETRTSDGATLADDAELFFSVEANKIYRFRFMVFFETAAAADFKFTVDGPASPTKVRMLTVTLSPDDTALQDLAVKTAFGFAAVAVTAAANTAGWFWVEGILQNGANDGGVYLRWAQNTSNAGNTTVNAGSYVQYGKA